MNELFMGGIALLVFLLLLAIPVGLLYCFVNVAFRLLARPLEIAREQALGSIEPKRVFWTVWLYQTFWRCSIFCCLIGIPVFAFQVWFPFELMKARYAAEPVRSIENIRIKIEGYREKNGFLPGIQMNTNGVPVRNSTDGTYCVSVCGKDSSHYIQTMFTCDSTNSKSSARLSYMAINGNLQMFRREDQEVKDHVIRLLGIEREDLYGMRLRPDILQFLVPYNDGDNYCYVVGMLGDGKGSYPKGTGYAVLEFCHLSVQTNIVAIYKRYKWEKDGIRLFLMPQSGFKGVPSSGGVIIPSLDGLIHATGRTAVEKEIAKFKDDLLRAGWNLQ